MDLQTFKKCDMHVHSSSCFSRTFEEEEFVSALIGSDLDVVAITDHNVIDVGLLERLHSEFSRCGKIVFAGVELNLHLKDTTIEMYELEPSKSSGYFHGIVWCAYEGRAKLQNVIAKLFNDGLEAGEVPCKDVSKQRELSKVFLEDLQSELVDVEHFFVPHVGGKDRNIDAYLPNDNGKNKQYKERLYYYSNAMAVEGGSKSTSVRYSYFGKDFQKALPKLLFSDPHLLVKDEASKRRAIGEYYSWIDFDGDSDSLLLAFSDPDSRISISEISPQNPQSNTDNFLEEVTFDLLDEKGKRCAAALSFSPGYNGIIGSRGSGKSMFARILTKAGLSEYEALVDPDSVKYKMRSGLPTSNPPKFLYLGQGELEGIFRDGCYSEVPFLKQLLEPIVTEARESSEKAAQELAGILDAQKNLALAFLDRYDTGPLSLDVLDNKEPAGTLIDMPVARMVNAGDAIKAAGKAYKRAADSIDEAVTTLEHEKLEGRYPESSDLETAFQSFANAKIAVLKGVAEDLKELGVLADGVSKEWFAVRPELGARFNAHLTVCNRQQDSAALARYKRGCENARQCLEDLLLFRVLLRKGDDCVDLLQREMAAPVAPQEIKVKYETIRIKLEFQGAKALSEAQDNLAKGVAREKGDLVARLCLCVADEKRTKGLINGQRVKGATKAAQIIRKYFECLRSDICEKNELVESAFLGKKPLSEMSPGMRADALLKLFLQDNIVEGDTVFLVLDQPEDNLDTGTIGGFLIDRIKEMKVRIQLFVVSHSAPVVVNGDARTVIVCRQSKEGAISYERGTINGPDTKKTIAEVLDGGEEYLTMRFNKYNFKVGGK